MRRISLFLLLAVSALCAPFAKSEDFGKRDIERGHIMLRNIKAEVRKSYYDPKFHGVDLDERFAAADSKVDAATSNGQVFAIIAQVLLDFDDSHLFFMPPPRVNRVEYGWRFQAVGDRCLVTAVKPGSDAAAKGLKPGDEVVGLDAFVPTRENLWKLRYFYSALRPQKGMRLSVKGPDGTERKLDVFAAITEGRSVVDLSDDAGFWKHVREMQNADALYRDRRKSVGDVLVWKMPEFGLDRTQVRDVMSDAGKHRGLVVDLRGNGGGLEEMLQDLVGYFFDHDVTIAEAHGRKKAKSIDARGHGSPYRGTVVVLVDSDSGSAAELFARVMQIEKRATVIGDRSSGAVMEAEESTLRVGVDTAAVPYGLSITSAELTMKDGKSLEHVGVTPDEVLLPAAADLAAGSDPVLARAVKLAGGEIDAKRAGSLFPVEWPR